MPALVPELVNAAMEPSTSPSDLLRRALVVARRLGVSELTDWISCRIPSDHIPIRSWPLFLARELMRDLIETLKAEQST